MSAGAVTGAAAAAAAQAAAMGYQMLVGGLLLELPPAALQRLSEQTRALVLTGTVKVTLFGPRRRLYFLPYQGVTFWCKVDAADRLGVRGAVEVPNLKLGPLWRYFG